MVVTACNSASIVYAALLCGTVVAFVGVVLFGSQFRGHLENKHPAVWRSLGEWKIRFPDGEVAEAALPEYIWAGMYKSLSDPRLNLLARKVKLATVLVAVCVLGLVLQESASFNPTPSACFKEALSFLRGR